MTTAGSPPNPESAEVLGRATTVVKDLQDWHERYSAQHPGTDSCSPDATVHWGLPPKVMRGDLPLIVDSECRTVISGIDESTMRVGGKCIVIKTVVMRKAFPSMRVAYFIQLGMDKKATAAGRGFVVEGGCLLTHRDSDSVEEALEVFEHTVSILTGLESEVDPVVTES